MSFPVDHNWCGEVEFHRRAKELCDAIAQAAEASGRSAKAVRLLPVTKTHPPEIFTAVAGAGFTAIGENRLQEVTVKAAQAKKEAVQIELIGHLQSNKARIAVEHCDVIQTVDSVKLLQRLNRLAAEHGKQMRIYLQVNAGEDPGKHGVTVQDAPALLEAALACSSLKVIGLMTIAPLEGGRSVARKSFGRLRELRDELQHSHGQPLPELSMGMSGDWEEAVAEGSTQIRLGTALFGPRR